MALRLNNSYFRLSNGILRSVEPVISSGAVLSYTISELLTTTGLGSWPKPEGVTEITVECWGAGGAGGGCTINNLGGDGGAGGSYARKIITYAPSSFNIVYSVGAGGVASTGTGLSGSSTTWAVDQVIAVGGAGGLANQQLDVIFLPTKGSTSGSVGDILYKGGDGYAPSLGFPSGLAGGTGGGGAGSLGSPEYPGNNSGYPEFGGGGGISDIITTGGVDGAIGFIYGGAGGGAGKISGGNRSGGAGAQGLIRVSYSIPPPLETFTGSNAAFSIRKLISTATASMQVQRSSDNALLDIGFQADGMLDTGSLLTFVGSNTGYVKNWYDQTGGGYTFTVFNDAVISQWPVIVTAGTLETTNGKPALRFNAGQTMIIAQANQSYTTGGGEWFQFAVGQVADATTRLLTKIGNSVNIAQSIRRGATGLESIGFNTVGGNATDTNGVSPGTAQFIAYAQRTTTGVEIYMNGTSNGATTITGTPATEAASTIVLGSFNPATLSFPWSGTVQEVIHYPQSSVTFDYRVGLTEQINAYYGTF